MAILYKSESRRQFTARLVSATGVLAFGPFPGQPGLSEQPPRIDADALKQLRARIKGDIVLPAETTYDAVRRVYFSNPATDTRPALIVRCAQEDDVRYAVEFARRHNLETTVRGGGHSPLGWGSCNGLVIVVSGMNRVTVDADKRTVRIEAGVLSGQVMRAAAPYGLAPILGQCPGVGAAGVTLGGGLGWLSGLHGASCDNLLSARLVTADGRILTVDAEQSPDLLWGLRGAGANFGVTTSFECGLHALETVTSGNIHYPVRAARPVLRFFRDLMATAPDAFQATLNLTPGDRGLFISLCHAGPASEADRLLQTIRKAATPTVETIKRQPFGDLASNTPTGAQNASFRYLATVYRDELSDDALDIVQDRLAAAPPEAILGVTHYMHGAVCRVETASTAFPLRQSGGIHFRIGVDWNDAAAGNALMAWADDAARALRPSSGERIYANYQSHASPATAAAVFGGNLSRLTAVKKRYDPTNVFRRNSNVEP